MGTQSQDEILRGRAERVIAGGMYGHQNIAPIGRGYPQYFARSQGCRLWDTDGKEYIDYMCAYGPNLLGYGHPEVEEAAASQRALGDCLTGPAPVMIDLAEAFVDTIDHADWVLFAKNGSDATSTCVAIARAATGKKAVLHAKGAYHGAAAWCTPVPAGTVDGARAYQITYEYNDVASLELAVAEAGDDLAAIVVSPFRHDVLRDQEMPTPEFATRMRGLCDQHHAALVLDDVRAGLRITHGCSWETIGVKPDLSAWSKAIANGYALATIAGREWCREAGKQVFATGSFWFAAVPMAASLKTLEVAKRDDVVSHIEAMGTLLRAGLDEQAKAHGYRLRQTGPPQMPMVLFDDDPKFKKGRRFTSEAAARGVYLHPWHNMFLCAAHREADIRQTLDVTDQAFAELQKSGI